MQMLLYVVYFSVIPVKFDTRCNHPHYLYLKKHVTRENDEAKPKDRTLFIVNVPPYATEVFLILYDAEWNLPTSRFSSFNVQFKNWLFIFFAPIPHFGLKEERYLEVKERLYIYIHMCWRETTYLHLFHFFNKI